MRNQTRLKPFDVKSILTYNIDGMVFCFIEDYVFVGNMIIIITMIILLKLNNFVALSETVEVGCLRHTGVTTISNQLQDGDRTDGWQNLTTQP